MHAMRYRIKGFALALASALALSASAQAQVAVGSLEVGAERCTTATLGAAIAPREVGEPIAGVTLERIAWHAATLDAAAPSH